jgi:hypothetical protein
MLQTASQNFRDCQYVKEETKDIDIMSQSNHLTICPGLLC